MPLRINAIGEWLRCVFVAVTVLVGASSALGNQESIHENSESPKLVPCGMFSDLYVPSLASPSHNDTAIRIMPSRDIDLMEAMEGYRKTGVSLVAYGKGGWVPAGLSDDLGAYYFIPLLARKFHLSLAKSISVFFLMSLIVAFLTAACGLIVVLHTALARAFGLSSLCFLTYFAYRIGDVYVFEYCIPLALTPWIVLMVKHRTFGWVPGLGFLVTGIVIGAGATVRLTSAIPILLFLITVVAAQPKSTPALKLCFTSFAIAGVLLPLLFFRYIEHKRDDLLLSYAKVDRTNLSRHVMWHLAYTGLGFISNPYVPGGVCDDVAKQKVQSIAPGTLYLSGQYDQVLRGEVLAIVRAHPLFVLFTFAAKLGIVLVVIVIFANVGLIAASLWPKPWALEVAFWVALSASALPVIFVVPATQYIGGLVSMSALYGVFSLNHAMNRMTVKLSKLTHGPTSSLMTLKRPNKELVVLSK